MQIVIRIDVHPVTLKDAVDVVKLTEVASLAANAAQGSTIKGLDGVRVDVTSVEVSG